MADPVSSPSPHSIDHLPQTPIVNFSPSEIQRYHGQHNLSLYAKILGQRVRYEHFLSNIHNIFKPCGTIEVISLLNNFYLLKFSDPSDYENALHNGPWTMYYNYNYYYVALIPWVPNFKPSERSITRTKVWIRLYELPVEYYDQEALSRIAEQIAPLVKIDPVTENVRKCRFARFCVDLDLVRPLVYSVKLPNGFLQRIVYEGLRYYQCWGCRMVGHVQRDCPESTSIATQEVRRSCVSPQVLDSPASEKSRTPPGDAEPESHVAAAGTGFNVPDVSRVNSPRESGIRPLDAAPGSSVAEAVSGFDDPDVSRVNSVRQSSTPRFGVIPESSAPPLSQMQIPDQKAAFIDLQTPFIADDHFQNVVCDSQTDENQELMTPGSRMKHQVYMKGVVEQEVMFDPVDFEVVSNAGLPKVFLINQRVPSFYINVLMYPRENGIVYRNILTPVEIDHTPLGATSNNPQNNVLLFNCRGARDPSVIQTLHDLHEKNNFSVVVLTETKIGWIEAGYVIGELGFSGYSVIEPVENIGGVLLMWDKNRIDIELGAYDQHSLYAFARPPVIAHDLGESWYVFGVDDV